MNSWNSVYFQVPVFSVGKLLLFSWELIDFLQYQAIWIFKGVWGKKSRHSCCIWLDNVYASVTENTEFISREIGTVQPCFLWCFNYSLRSWGNKACHRSGNIFSPALLITVGLHCYFFALDLLHTVLPLQMELSQDVSCPKERPCCSEEGQLPQGPGA